MKKRISLLVVVCALVAVFLPQSVVAQLQPISPIDTFKVLDAMAGPGDTVAMDLFVVNDSVGLAAIAAYVNIDNSILEWVGVLDSTYIPPTFYIDFDLMPRAQIDSLFFSLPLVMVTNTTIAAGEFGALAGAGSVRQIQVGRGSIIRFYLRVKDGVAIGTQTTVELFNPVEDPPHDYVRQCQYADSTGATGTTVFPTLVSGTLTIDTTTVPPPENTPPSINPISQTVWVVQPSTNINFTVSATDADVPAQTITLSASSLPAGATFGTGGSVSGLGNVSSTFNWTPTAAQVGNYTITFNCQDSEGAWATPRSVSITVQSVTPPEEDLLFTTSSRSYGVPAGGIAGFTGAAIPVNLVEAQPHDIYGVQFDFIYQSSVLTVDSIVPTERLTDFTVYDDRGVTPGRIRVVAFGLANETVQTGVSSAIFHFWVSVSTLATPGEYPIDFDDAWESVSSNPSYPSVKLDFDTTGVFIVDQLGDVNSDGYINVADVVSVVAYIIGTSTLDRRQFAAADMNGNAVVDVNDLVAIINTIFGGSLPVSGPWDGPLATLSLGSDDYLVSADNTIEIKANLPTEIAGVQLEISYNPDKVRLLDPEKSSAAEELNLRYRDDGNGRMVLLLYPQGGSGSIDAGEGVLVSLPIAAGGEYINEEDIQITSAVLADPSATEIPVEGFNRTALPRSFSLEQNYPNPFNPQTTIEFSINAASAYQQVRLDVYNILGERVKTLLDEALAAGRYRAVWDGRNNTGTVAASGVYFYRLSVGDLSETKKMILMK